MDKKTLESLMGGHLKAERFKKKASTWYLDAPGSLIAVDLQKSNYGSQFYINLCCVPAGMQVEGMPSPKEHKCPVRIRLTAAYPDHHRAIENAFNLEDGSLDDTARAGKISILMKNMVIPFLDYMRDAASLKNAIEKGVFDQGMVNLEAKKHLSIR